MFAEVLHIGWFAIPHLPVEQFFQAVVYLDQVAEAAKQGQR